MVSLRIRSAASRLAAGTSATLLMAAALVVAAPQPVAAQDPAAAQGPAAGPSMGGWTNPGGAEAAAERGDPAEATPGLVRDEPAANPQLVTGDCTGGCPVTWTVTSVAEVPASYTAQTTGPDSMDIAVSPASFEVGAGESRQLTVTVTGAPVASPAVADVRLVTGDTHPDGQPIAPVRYQIAVTPEQTGPAIEVDPAELPVTVAAGTATEQALTIGNVGGEPLIWRVDEAEAGTEARSGRLAQLAEGVLLVADEANNRIMAFDPETGDLVDPDFIPENPAADHSRPGHAILNADQTGFWVSDQLTDEVHSYDLEGNWEGVFIPAGGQLNNNRGIAVSPDGTLLVTNASTPNANSVVEFDGQTGEFLGQFIESGAGNLTSPWDILFRDQDVLVTGSNRVVGYLLDGTFDREFFSPITFAEQMYQQEDGNILVGSFSGSSGVWELTADGELVGQYTGVSGNRGVYPLPNGNILTTNSGGVHEIDRGTALVETKFDAANARFITPVQLGEGCAAPEDVPWLSVAPSAGTTAPGASSELTVQVDASGLPVGSHAALLCVTSNDPGRPLVEVPVNVTVVACSDTVVGVHEGPLTVTEGVTCLAAGAQVLGEVNVAQGAGLAATAAVVQGPVSAIGAARLDLRFTQVTGPVLVTGGTGQVSIFGNQVTGSVSLFSNATGETPTSVSGNTVIGTLSCFGNQPPPTDHGLPNTATGGKLGQCAEL